MSEETMREKYARHLAGRSEQTEGLIRATDAQSERVRRTMEEVLDHLYQDRQRHLREWWMRQPRAMCEWLPKGGRKWRPVEMRIAMGHSHMVGFLLDGDGPCTALSGARLREAGSEHETWWGPGPHYRLTGPVDPVRRVP